MDKKILLRLDFDSIDPNQRNFIITNNKSLTHLHDDLYVFKFNSLVFTHALFLLGTDESKYGFDLTNYLECALNFLNRQTSDEFITLSIGSSDFKKRAAEDLGVAVAALFMVQSFNLDWKTIIQIPRNSKLSKRTPDFSGFNLGKEQFIFECKGTSVANNVEGQITKALEQVKKYPINEARKYAITSYFSNNKKIFYPISFVIDPPFNSDFELDANTSANIHFLDILNNIGLKQTSASMLGSISKKIEIKKDKDSPFAFKTYDYKDIRPSIDDSSKILSEESTTLIERKYKQQIYIGKEYTPSLKEGKVKLFFGIDREVAMKSVRLDLETKISETLYEKDEKSEISLFSDGSILILDLIEESMKS